MLIAAFHTQGPGNYSICLLGQNCLASIFVMKTNQVKGYFQLNRSLGTSFAFPVITVNDEHAKPTIIFIIFWDFLMFSQIFILQQVKQSVIICYKHGIYKLPHELPNELRLRCSGN